MGVESSKMNTCIKHDCSSKEARVDSCVTVRLHAGSAGDLSEQMLQLSSVTIEAPVETQYCFA